MKFAPIDSLGVIHENHSCCCCCYSWHELDGSFSFIQKSWYDGAVTILLKFKHLHQTQCRLLAPDCLCSDNINNTKRLSGYQLSKPFWTLDLCSYKQGTFNYHFNEDLCVVLLHGQNCSGQKILSVAIFTID